MTRKINNVFFPEVFNPVSPVLAEFVKKMEEDIAWSQHQPVYPDPNDLGIVDIAYDYGYSRHGNVYIHVFDEEDGTWFTLHEVFCSIAAAQHFADCEIGGSYRIEEIERHGTGIKEQQTIKLTMHIDPSHGWLQVETMLLIQLGIRVHEISHYSYSGQYGQIAYLEEDCDAGLVLNALKERGFTVEINEEVLDTSHWIRDLPRWTSGKPRAITDGNW